MEFEAKENHLVEQFEYLLSVDRVLSCGVQKNTDSKQYNAWVNYSKIGNWNTYGETPHRAINILVKEIKDYISRKDGKNEI